MDTEFVASNPHQKARPRLDEILSQGSERVMIACAFLTGAGAVIIQRHLSRLRQPGSCLVVSSEPPTDIPAVNELGRAAPGNVWMHFTGNLPFEKKVGSALMHSKVFYAEGAGRCWLWVGSHNLTGRATEGANLEAAVLLTGVPDEAPFVAARQHIEACRAESTLCPTETPPPPDGEPANVVVIHAEADQLPGRVPPWHVLLEMQSAEYDGLLKPPADVRLHLYARGALSAGWQSATPVASYRGTLTGLNFTNIHPTNPGIPAQWNERDYRIIDEGVVLRFSETVSSSYRFVTQAVINISGPADTRETFLSEKPKAEREERIRNFDLGEVDPDLRRFFTRESIEYGRLVYELPQRGDAFWKIPLEDLRPRERLLLATEARHLNVHVQALGTSDSKQPRHPFIVRGKFKLRKRDLP